MKEDVRRLLEGKDSKAKEDKLLSLFDLDESCFVNKEVVERIISENIFSIQMKFFSSNKMIEFVNTEKDIKRKLIDSEFPNVRYEAIRRLDLPADWLIEKRKDKVLFVRMQAYAKGPLNEDEMLMLAEEDQGGSQVILERANKYKEKISKKVLEKIIKKGHAFDKIEALGIYGYEAILWDETLSNWSDNPTRARLFGVLIDRAPVSWVEENKKTLLKDEDPFVVDALVKKAVPLESPVLERFVRSVSSSLWIQVYKTQPQYQLPGLNNGEFRVMGCEHELVKAWLSHPKTKLGHRTVSNLLNQNLMRSNELSDIYKVLDQRGYIPSETVIKSMKKWGLNIEDWQSKMESQKLKKMFKPSIKSPRKTL